MPTIDADQRQAITDFLEGRHIPSGLGTAEEACSIAAINLALTGELTDHIPDCMSLVIGKWIIVVQDAVPDELRNSAEWRRLLPLAAGTGRARADEEARQVEPGHVLHHLAPTPGRGAVGPYAGDADDEVARRAVAGPARSEGVGRHHPAHGGPLRPRPGRPPLVVRDNGRR